MEIGYCPKCNVPLRGERCGVCNSQPQRLKFHDMGDIRPASPYETKILTSLLPNEMRGYIRKRIILLARQPGLDYRKDVYLDGFKFGSLEYIKDQRWRWRFIPTGKGASLIYSFNGADFEIREKGHLKGKKLGKPIDQDWAIFLSGSCVGVAVRTPSGSKVKDIFCRKSKTRRRATMEDAVKANYEFLERIEKKAISVIKHSGAKYVAFSGGKDSEVATYLAHLAGVKKVVFANTGLEFSETERFARKFAEFIDMEFVELYPERDFWDVVSEKGIPTKDNRWCTKFLKLQQIMKLSGVLVDGTRRYESFGRMGRRRTAKLGNLKVIYPLIDWLALDIWLYIHYRGLPYNPIYDMGYERIGCYMCPSMLNAEFHNLKRTHPELFKKWYNFLRNSYTHEEIMDGLWRWKVPPPKMREISNS